MHSRPYLRRRYEKERRFQNLPLEDERRGRASSAVSWSGLRLLSGALYERLLAAEARIDPRLEARPSRASRHALADLLTPQARQAVGRRLKGANPRAMCWELLATSADIGATVARIETVLDA